MKLFKLALPVAALTITSFSMVGCGSASSVGGSSSLSGGSGSSSETYGSDSDEFTGSVDIQSGGSSGWTRYDPSGVRTTAIDIGQTVAGKLTILAANVTNGGWFQDNYGVHLYKDVTGNFAFSVKINVMAHDNFASFPSDGNYRAAGIVVRDGSGNHSGDENWVMFNSGWNGGSGQREVKKTTNSSSTLYLNSQPSQEEHLLVCRVGSDFYFYYYDGGTWNEEQYIHGTTTRAGGPALTEIPESGTQSAYFNHPAISSTARVGMIAHSYSDTSSQQNRSEFEYARFAATAPSAKADCTSGFTNVD